MKSLLVCIALAAAAQPAAPTVGFERVLSELQGRVNSGTARQDLERFNQSFDRDFTANWNARPPAARRTLLSNALGYLGAMRGPGLRAGAGVLLANAYRRIARFQEGLPAASQLGSGWSMGPIYGYQNSALILTQLANENPNDPTVRGELLLDVGRIEALGGSMPILMSVPVGGAAPSEERGIPASALIPAGASARADSSSMPVLPGPPALDLPAVPAVDREAARNALDRFASVIVIARQAQDGLRPVQESVTAMGLALHPDTIRALTRMHAYLVAAKAEIEARRFADATASLGIAEAEARKALKVIGR